MNNSSSPPGHHKTCSVPVTDVFKLPQARQPGKPQRQSNAQYRILQNTGDEKN
jgi:hypothetical protein